MPKPTFPDAYRRHPLLLTEGGVGLRLTHAYGLTPDPDIHHAAFLYQDDSRIKLRKIYLEYAGIARSHGLPLLLMSNTRRANRERLTRSAYAGRNIMTDFAAFLQGIAAEADAEIYIGGIMGSKGDAYRGDEGLSTAQAIEFHSWQAEAYASAPIDYLFAGIMPSFPEAMGMAEVMARTGKPYILSLMVSAEGRLLDGTPIHDAIAAIDDFASRPPLCYMSNCVHPSLLLEALSRPMNDTALVRERFRGLQANAARFDPKAVDGSPELHTTSAESFADAFEALDDFLPMKIIGGCCGTDGTHLGAIAARFQKRRSS